MSGAGAFRGDPALKSEAVADAAACTHPGWHAAASEADRADCVQTFGLTEGFLTLTATAARPPFMEGSGAFLKQTLQAVAPGADIDALVRSWMVHVWDHPELGVSRKLADTAAFEPASRLIARIRDYDQTSATRSEWRQARTALLATLKGVSPVTAGFARVVAAMAWDPTTTPGLGGDVWTAWERAAVGEVDLAYGWDQPAQDAVVETLRHAMRQAHEAAEPLGDDATPQDRDALEAEMKIKVDAFIEEAGATERLAALHQHWDENLSDFFPAWRDEALQTIIDVCSRSKVVAPVDSAPS